MGGAAPPDPLGEMRRIGVRPTVNVFDVGEARWLALAVRAGLFPTPLYVKLFLCEQLVTGPFPDEHGIDAYRSQLPPELELECTIVPYTMMRADRAETLLRAALAPGPARTGRHRRQPVRLPRRSATPSWSRVPSSWCARRAYEPATPAAVRRRLGLAQ